VLPDISAALCHTQTDMFTGGRMADSIVTDEAISSLPHHHHHNPSLLQLSDESPAKSSKVAPPTSPRCDSGFSSGPVVPLHTHGSGSSDASLSPSPLPEHTKVGYFRLDSGISDIESSVKCLVLDEATSANTLSSPKRGDSVAASNNAAKVTALATSSGESLKQLNPEFMKHYVADKDGDCQLHLAIASGYTEVVFALIRMAPHPAYLNIQNNEQYAPLHIAVLMNLPNIVRGLIVAGATNEIKDLEGNTPLHLASKRGYLECAEALLRSVSVEELKEASAQACESHRNLHKILDYKNYNGEHSIHLATFGQHYNFIRFLCWSGADMNATEGRSGRTPLHYAAGKRDLHMVALLAARKSLGGCEVNLNMRDYYGRTPVQLAFINGFTDVTALLSSQPGCETATYQESDEDFEFDTDEDIPEVTSAYSDLEVNGRIVQSSA